VKNSASLPISDVRFRKKRKSMGWRKLFRAEKVHSGREPAPPPAVSKPNRRRNHRVSAFLPVFIYAHSHDEPFVELAVTLNVSASGGLLSLSREVAPSQELLIANTQTNEELPCRIARVIKTHGGSNLVGFEFLRPSPRFWSIEFRS
jgi:c-di-GMP-binding flagellar brake protein YcgR